MTEDAATLEEMRQMIADERERFQRCADEVLDLAHRAARGIAVAVGETSVDIALDVWQQAICAEIEKRRRMLPRPASRPFNE